MALAVICFEHSIASKVELLRVSCTDGFAEAAAKCHQRSVHPLPAPSLFFRVFVLSCPDVRLNRILRTGSGSGNLVRPDNPQTISYQFSPEVKSSLNSWKLRDDGEVETPIEFFVAILVNGQSVNVYASRKTGEHLLLKKFSLSDADSLLDGILAIFCLA